MSLKLANSPSRRSKTLTRLHSVGAGFRNITTLPRTRLFEAIKSHDAESTAVLHSLSGRQFSYGSLLQDVAIAKQRLASDAGTLDGERVAFLVENSYDYVGARQSHLFLLLLFHLLFFSSTCPSSLPLALPLSTSSSSLPLPLLFHFLFSSTSSSLPLPLLFHFLFYSTCSPSLPLALLFHFLFNSIVHVLVAEGNLVTLLGILSSNAIAVPLSPAFPSEELRYILDQSSALMLLASAKFANKADDVLAGELTKRPISSRPDKIMQGSTLGEQVLLEERHDDKSGMMLYTSGTTNKPVSLMA
jgi:acyl-CoA synthetase (AMP-forming)/AMP-acid ligase II